MIQPDGKENYPDEFKRDAVALYRDTDRGAVVLVALQPTKKIG
jgi:transposase-like protein